MPESKIVPGSSSMPDCGPGVVISGGSFTGWTVTRKLREYDPRPSLAVTAIEQGGDGSSTDGEVRDGAADVTLGGRQFLEVGCHHPFDAAVGEGDVDALADAAGQGPFRRSVGFACGGSFCGG